MIKFEQNKSVEPQEKIEQEHNLFEKIIGKTITEIVHESVGYPEGESKNETHSLIDFVFSDGTTAAVFGEQANSNEDARYWIARITGDWDNLKNSELEGVEVLTDYNNDGEEFTLYDLRTAKGSVTIVFDGANLAQGELDFNLNIS